MVERFSGEWKASTIGEEYTVIMGQSPASSSYNDMKQGVPFVQGNADIIDRVTAPKRYTSEPTKICEAGATILSVRAPVGSVSRANQTVCLGRGVCAIVGEPQDFVFYLMQYHENSWKNLEQGSTFKAVNAKTIRDFEIYIPADIEEQHAIADTLSAFDRHISALSALIAKKQAVRQGALEDLMTGRTRLEGFCGSWKTVKLGDMLKISRGASPRPIEAFLTSGTNGVNWIKIGDASKHEKYITQTAEKITEDGAAHSVRVKAGDFILSNSMSFGRPYILSIDGCIHDGWLRLYDYQDFADREFLYYLLSSSSTRRQYVMFAAGSGVQNLNKEVVKKIEVNLPPMDEQLAISSVLSALDSELSALNSERAKFSAIRQAAISDLLTGKIRLERTAH